MGTKQSPSEYYAKLVKSWEVMRPVYKIAGCAPSSVVVLLGAAVSPPSFTHKLEDVGRIRPSERPRGALH